MEELIKKSEKCMKLIEEKGIDKAFCNVSASVTNEFNVDGGEFSLFRTLFNHSFSVTVYNKGKKGNIVINKFDDDSIESAVNECISASESAPADDAWCIAEVSKNDDFVEGSPEADTEKLFDRVKELMDCVKQKHPKIMMEQMIVSHTKYEVVYANSNGVHFTTLGGKYSIDLMFSGHDGDKSSSFYSSGVVTDSLDKPFIELGCIEKDLSDVEKQIDTTPLEGKFVGTVLFPPQAFADTLGSALGNFCGGAAILDGTSIWKDMIGKKVADERITISINPLDERIICGERYTDEGFVSENYDIIKNGILQSFLLNQYLANKTGKERAKNSSFSLVMQSGEQSLEEMIKSIDKGIIVGRFSGGEPGANGEFSGVAKNSFYIENGAIKYALSETMISGNLADLLMNLKGFSKELVCDGASVLPYAAFENVTISGK